jgi:hypothetical protein
MSQFYDNASLVVIPSGYKAGTVYAQKPLTTDGQLAFTRTGDTATRVNSAGLIEKVRTNLLLQSNSFDTTWTNVNTTETSGQSGYDGSSDAWLLSKSAANGYLIQSISSSGVQTLSVYAKAGTLNWLRLNINFTSGTDPIAFFDLANGVLGSTPAGVIDSNIQSIGGGWYRCDIISNGTISDIRIFPADADNDISGTSGNIYIQDAQLEASDFGATDYIPTTTAAVSVGPTANTARLDYLGSTCPRLLLEPQATTLLQYSEQMNNAYWTKANLSVSANTTATLDPSGYYGADKLVEAATTSTHEINHAIFALTAASYTYSIFAKAAERSWIVLSIQGQYTFFDIANGVIGVNAAGNTPKIEAYGNGWYRCSITRTATATNNFGLIRLASADNTPNYAGNGTSGLYVWGANLTATSYLQSYIPTLAASATRGADACSKTGISSLIGQTEGTIFVQGEAVTIDAQASSPIYLTISDGTQSNITYIQQRSNGTIRADFFEGSVQQARITSTTTYPIGTSLKMALAYASGNFAFYINGVLIGTASGTSIPAMSQINVGAFVATDYTGAAISQTLLFKTRLTNAELAELTTL